MRKWISYLMAAFLLIFASLLPIEASAETLPDVKFNVTNNDVKVTLQLPEGKTETITSLQFQLTVSIVKGSMKTDPAFSFSDELESTVKDAAVSKDTDGNYLIDIILSGKQEQDIFKDSETATIGTLSFSPSSSAFQASVTFGMKKDGNWEPVITYVTADGQAVQTASLSSTKEATVSSEENTSSSTPPASFTPSPSAPSQSGSSTTITNAPAGSTAAAPVLPEETETTVVPVTSDSITPAVTPETPVTPDTPSVSETPSTSEVPADSEVSAVPETPVSTEQSFHKKKSPSLKISVKNGSNRITLRWNTVKGADGYLIYQYNKNTKTYKKIKKISGQSVTSYSKKMKYGSLYSFKIRAFSLNENGEKTYGTFSSVTKAVTAPEKVKKLSCSKGVLSWKKVSNADGYQILYSTKKNGTYSPLKTTKKTSIKSSSLLKKKKKTYCKIKAYTKTPDGKRIYSSPSKACTLKN